MSLTLFAAVLAAQVAADADASRVLEPMTAPASKTALPPINSDAGRVPVTVTVSVETTVTSPGMRKTAMPSSTRATKGTPLN